MSCIPVPALPKMRCWYLNTNQNKTSLRVYCTSLRGGTTKQSPNYKKYCHLDDRRDLLNNEQGILNDDRRRKLRHSKFLVKYYFLCNNPFNKIFIKKSIFTLK